MTRRKAEKILTIGSQALKLPEWVKLYKLNHHSPSQINTEEDQWGYKYLYLAGKSEDIFQLIQI